MTHLLISVVQSKRCEVWPSSPGTGMGSNSLRVRQIGSGHYSSIILGLKDPYSLIWFKLTHHSSMSSGSSVLFQTVLPKQSGALSRPTVCLHWASGWLTSESFITDIYNDVRRCHYIIVIIDWTYIWFYFYYCLFLFLQVKKSGKEPKVGAEITLGEMSRKTTVRPQTSFSLE